MEDEGLDPAEPTEADTAAPQISESQKRLVQRVHINIGHPPKDRFLRALRAAGALPQILHYVHNEYQCDDCRLRQRPGFHRKAQLPRTFSFNKVVCLDFLYVKWRDLNVAVFNMVDLGTGFQVAVRAPIAECAQQQTQAQGLQAMLQGVNEVRLAAGDVPGRYITRRPAEQLAELPVSTHACSSWRMSVRWQVAGFNNVRSETPSH